MLLIAKKSESKIKTLETVRKAVQTGIKLIHCIDVAQCLNIFNFSLKDSKMIN